jgi:transcriptional regulator with XRE-family HTH domain
VNIRRGRRPKPLASSKHRVTPLGAALRAWREYRGLSQTELAIQAGLGVAQDGRAHISSIELGKIQRPEDETLEKIGAVLGVTLNDLRSGRMPPTGQTEETLETVEYLAPQESLAFPSLLERGFLAEDPSHRNRFISALNQILDEANFPCDIERLVQELILGSAEGICERMERQLNDG